MARTKLYKLIIAVLVIINAGMLIFFLSRRPPHMPPKPGDLVERLGIEGSNRELINKLAKEHHAEKRKLMDNGRELHDELFSKIGTDQDVSNIQERIEANFAETERMTFEFFSEISKLCTPEQVVELKKTIHHAFRQMRKPPGR